jgi:hypothetical protein
VVLSPAGTNCEISEIEGKFSLVINANNLPEDGISDSSNLKIIISLRSHQWSESYLLTASLFCGSDGSKIYVTVTNCVPFPTG